MKDKYYNYILNKHCKCGNLINDNATYCKPCADENKREHHYCVDCKKEIFTHNADRCMMCFNVLRSKPKTKCKLCGKTLRHRKSLHCRRCNGKIHSLFLTGCKLSDKHKQNIGKSSKRMWKNLELKERIIKKIIESNHKSPNKSEKLLKRILNKDYSFVGDGKVMIGGFNPDFIDFKNNKIIELYGNYWHNLPGYKERDKRRLKTYKQLGYNTLVIWDNELKYLDKLLLKINNFIKGE